MKMKGSRGKFCGYWIDGLLFFDPSIPLSDLPTSFSLLNLLVLSLPFFAPKATGRRRRASGPNRKVAPGRIRIHCTLDLRRNHRLWKLYSGLFVPGGSLCEYGERHGRKRKCRLDSEIEEKSISLLPILWLFWSCLRSGFFNIWRIQSALVIVPAMGGG